ncbi:MAG TPA: hypothetical protein VMP01_27130 [Pirellulaceae bacterium]|nr:hypothetical protein [Pirellulaceae bacterium]
MLTPEYRVMLCELAQDAANIGLDNSQLLTLLRKAKPDCEVPVALHDAGELLSQQILAATGLLAPLEHWQAHGDRGHAEPMPEYKHRISPVATERMHKWLPQLAQTTNSAEPQPDGPIGTDGFRWQRREEFGLATIPFKLVEMLWQARDRTCWIAEAIDALYPDSGPEDGLSGARRQANRFFRERNIPLAIKIKKELERVTLSDRRN